MTQGKNNISARLTFGTDATQKTLVVKDGEQEIDRGVMISSLNTGMAIMQRGGMSSVRQSADGLMLVPRQGDPIPVEIQREKASA